MTENTRKTQLGTMTKPVIWAAIVIVLTVTFATAPFLTGNLSFMFYMMLWMTMATAFNFVAGLAGYMPFGYVAFYGVGAYATGILYKSTGLPIVVALIGAGAAGIVVAMIMAPTLRLRGVYFGIVSLAMALAAKLIISLMPPHITGGSMGLILSSANNPKAAYYTMFVVLMLALATGTWLFFSRTGTALRAIRDDQEAAEVVGVNVVRTRLKAWVAAAVFPAFAGGIEAWYTNAIDLESSFNLLVTAKSIVYAMAGGLGYLTGPILGSGLLYGVDHLIWQQFPTLNLLLLGIVIVVLILALPRGIVGAFAQRFSRLRKYIP